MQFKDDVAMLNLSGKFLAGSDGPYLRQKVKDLIDAGTQKLIINFAEVPYIDSTGLGFLAGSRVTAQNSGVRLILAEVNAHVRRILDDLNLSQFFVIAPNESAALELMSKSAPAGEVAPAKSKPESKKP